MSLAVKDLVERVVATFVQAFVAALLASPVFDNLAGLHVNLSSFEAAGLAGIAAVVSLVKNLLTVWLNKRRPTPPVSPASAVSA